MSHGIKQHDVIDATQPCWHGLEVLCESITKDTMRANREIVKRPIYTPDMVEIEGWREIVVPDLNGGLTLSVQKESYEVIQNARFLELVDNSFAGVDYEITAAGTLENWRRFFASVDIDKGGETLVNGDAFKSRLTVLTSHDATQAGQLFDCKTRVVCQNTINQALGEGGRNLNYRVRHTSGAEQRLVEIEQHIESLLQKRAEFYASLEYLNTIEMPHKTAAEIVAGVVIKTPEAGTRVKNRGVEVARLFSEGKGNRGETAYDLLNAFTEYWTHHAVASNRRKNMVSSDFGTGAQRKVEAHTLLLDAEARREAAEQGRRVLAEVK